MKPDKEGVRMIREMNGGLKLEIVQGDITKQSDVAVIVNAANAQLLSGGGVAGAIHRAAGPALEVECRPLAPIRPGEVVITGAHALPNKRIIHVLGPVYGQDRPERELLAACYRNALLLAEREALPSLATPAVSTGIFGYPIAEAAEVALSTVIRTAPSLMHLRLVRFVLFSPRDVEAHRSALEHLLAGLT